MRFDSFDFSPELIQSRWIFCELPGEDVPRLAADALEVGFDGRCTRQLAGLLHPTRADVEPLMPGFLRELGVPNPLTKIEAGRLIAQFVAAAIVEARVQPYVGAHFIWKEIVIGMHPHRAKELLYFVGAASEYEDCPAWSDKVQETQREIEADIVEAARKLLDAERPA